MIFISNTDLQPGDTRKRPALIIYWQERQEKLTSPHCRPMLDVFTEFIIEHSIRTTLSPVRNILFTHNAHREVRLLSQFKPIRIWILELYPKSMNKLWQMHLPTRPISTLSWETLSWWINTQIFGKQNHSILHSVTISAGYAILRHSSSYLATTMVNSDIAMMAAATTCPSGRLI